jgi:hypothetical protein
VEDAGPPDDSPRGSIEGATFLGVPSDVAKTGEAVVAYIAKNPSQSVEQIGNSLGQKIAELAPPIIRMIEAEKLRTTGKRRGTRCFASSGSASRSMPAGPTMKVTSSSTVN